MNALENQTLSLAGIFQAAVLIEELAHAGKCDAQGFDSSLDSLFKFDAPTALDVFGEIGSLTRGFAALGDYLGGRATGSGRNIAYYVLSMMKIALQITRDPDLSERLYIGLRLIESRASEFNMSRANTIGKIDVLYQDHISPLQPRIMVRGDQSHLLNDDNAARIRTLLLAGIRAAVLWRQLGGSKWKLVVARKKYVALARGFLDSEPA